MHRRGKNPTQAKNPKLKLGKETTRRRDERIIRDNSFNFIPRLSNVIN
jgi:hypothetical protein